MQVNSVFRTAAKMRAMRVFAHGPSSSIRLVEIDVPAHRENQLLIAVKCAGINPVDTYIRDGVNNYKSTAAFPYTPGRDGSGVIVSVGSSQECADFSVGQRVYFSSCVTGSSAEYTICWPANTFTLPTSLSFEVRVLTLPRLCVCVSTCLCVYMSVCLCVYMSVCLCVYMSVCLCVYMSVCLCVYMSVCLCVYMSLCY